MVTKSLSLLSPSIRYQFRIISRYSSYRILVFADFRETNIPRIKYNEKNISDKFERQRIRFGRTSQIARSVDPRRRDSDPEICFMSKTTLPMAINFVTLVQGHVWTGLP